MTFINFNCPLFTFSKKLKHWNLVIIGYWLGQVAKLKRTWKPSPSPPHFSKDYWELLPLLISINWTSLVTLSCDSKDILKNLTLSHVLILIVTSQIWSIMGWLKIQKLEYLENGTLFFCEIKKFLISVSDVWSGIRVKYINFQSIY